MILQCNIGENSSAIPQRHVILTATIHFTIDPTQSQCFSTSFFPRVVLPTTPICIVWTASGPQTSSFYPQSQSDLSDNSEEQKGGENSVPTVFARNWGEYFGAVVISERATGVFSEAGVSEERRAIAGWRVRENCPGLLASYIRPTFINGINNAETCA